MSENYKLTIGLEIHAQINSIHKLFSLAKNSTYQNPNEKDNQYNQEEKNPNTHITHLELGMPGILPIVNKEPVIEAIKAGLAINGTINKLSFFDRKHYWYFDLPNGYQITQFYMPIVVNGFIEINTPQGPKKIRIKQIHMEADAGKNIHEKDCSLLDYNRVAVCLIETVTEPDISSPEEAVAFAEEYHRILTYLGVCLGDMEKGNFRMDVNISAKDLTTGKTTNRVEVKNLNSFNNMVKAINYEYQLHINALKNNEIIPQSTRFFDANRGKTGLLRLKESASDYMHIRDNDLPPLIIDNAMMTQAENFLKSHLLPSQCRKILMDKGLTEKQAYEITKDKENWHYFHHLMETMGDKLKNINLLYNLVTMELATLINKTQISPLDSKITPQHILDIMKAVDEKIITMASYKTLLEILWTHGGDVMALIKEKNMEVIQDDSIVIGAIQEAIKNNPNEFQRYKSGETKLFQFFVGQVMKLTKGKSNPDKVNELLKTHLDN
jgi:aspartyl-tRNA(Asn)/glutamyl-tRNA(Gln) amidotransferase subunit B